MRLALKDPVSGLTHLFGCLLAILGTGWLAAVAASRPLSHLLAFTVFGFSLVLLYAASSIYHLVPRGAERGSILHRLDHMMIYVLIAGTYTPVCVITLEGSGGWTLLAVIWGLTLGGTLVKALTKRVNHWSSTVSYVALGWIVVLVAPQLVARLPSAGLAWFAAGGAFYTIGALVYAFDRPRLCQPWLGSHEWFHLLVMAGSASHFWAVIRYVA